MRRDLINFSTREWFGIMLGAGWGLLLGLIPFHRGGVLPVVLLVPPVAYLLLPRRPFFSWQISIIAAAVAGAYRELDPQDPSESVWPLILLGWLGYSLLSAPWPYIFQRRAQRAREQGDTGMRATISYIGVGLLVFIACGLIILGLGMCLTGYQSTGFLMATIGIGLTVYLNRNATKFGINQSVKDFFVLLLGLASATAILMIIGSFHDRGFHCPPSDSNCTPLPSAGEMFLDSVISFEAIAALIWLRGGKRVAPSGENIGLRDQM